MIRRASGANLLKGLGFTSISDFFCHLLRFIVRSSVWLNYLIPRIFSVIFVLFGFERGTGATNLVFRQSRTLLSFHIVHHFIPLLLFTFYLELGFSYVAHFSQIKHDLDVIFGLINLFLNLIRLHQLLRYMNEICVFLDLVLNGIDRWSTRISFGGFTFGVAA